MAALLAVPLGLPLVPLLVLPSAGAAPTQRSLTTLSAVATDCDVSGTGAVVVAVRDACRRALPRVRARFPAWTSTASVVVPADSDAVRQLAPEAGDVRGVAALATRDRIVVVPEGFALLSDRGRDVVLAHELTHLATRALTTPATPLWLVEGLADQVALSAFPLPDRVVAAELAAQVASGDRPARLPTNDDFATAASAQAYQASWLAVDLLVQQAGAARALEVYRSASDGSPDLKLAGSDPDTFLIAWRTSLLRRLR